jgi:hypothetical protein
MNVTMKTQDIIKQCRDALREMPHLHDKSVGIVARSLKDKHTTAAIWMQKTHGMALDIHNLHDLIENYDSLEAVSTFVPIVVDTLEIEKGRFNPAHLLAYFNR